MLSKQHLPSGSPFQLGQEIGYSVFSITMLISAEMSSQCHNLTWLIKFLTNYICEGGTIVEEND